MRWSWLRSCALSFLLGPVPSPGDAGEGETAEPQPETGRAPDAGQVLEGIGACVAEREGEGGPERMSTVWVSPLDECADFARWRAIAAQTARLPSFGTGEQELAFATRIDDGEGALAISPLGFLLCLLPSLDRTCLVSSWAASPDESTRRVLARALAAPFTAVGVDDAIEHLQADPSEEVRRLADTAAALRLGGAA